MSYVNVPIKRGFEQIKRLFELVSKENLGYIAGGYCTYMCSPRTIPATPRDVDIFTSGEEAYNKLVQILTYQEKLKVKHESDISITYQTKNNEIWKDVPMINLIKPRKKNQLLTYGSKMEEVLDNFDFSICKVGILNENECLADFDFLEDEKHGKIRIMKMESPVACLIRLCKYAKKGYKIPATLILDVLREWDERGQEYKDKLNKKLDELRDNGGKYKKHYTSWPYVGSYVSTQSDDPFSMETDSRYEKMICKELDEVEDDALDLYQLIRCG